MEILETFPRVFCFPKSRINENGGKETAGYVKSVVVIGEAEFRSAKDISQPTATFEPALQ